MYHLCTLFVRSYVCKCAGKIIYDTSLELFYRLSLMYEKHTKTCVGKMTQMAKALVENFRFFSFREI